MNTKKVLYKKTPEPWEDRPEISVVYDFEFEGQSMPVGTKFKIKNDRTEYKFMYFATNVEKETCWIAAVCPEGFRFLRPEKVHSLVGVRRARKKS